MYTGISQNSLETLTIAQNSTGFSSIKKMDKSQGYAAMWLSISAGSVSINQQVGLDRGNVVFLNAVDSTNTAIGVVCTTFSAGTYLIQFNPVLAPFIRYRVVETNVGSTTVQLQPIFMEDR